MSLIADFDRILDWAAAAPCQTPCSENNMCPACLAKAIRMDREEVCTPIQRLRHGEEVPRVEILADVDRLLELYKKRGSLITKMMICIEDDEHDFATDSDGTPTCSRCGYYEKQEPLYDEEEDSEFL